MSRGLQCFGMTFLISIAIAALFPKADWAEITYDLLVLGSIMLFFAVARSLGFPMRGNVNPRDIACWAAGLLLAAAVLFVLT